MRTAALTLALSTVFVALPQSLSRSLSQAHAQDEASAHERAVLLYEESARLYDQGEFEEAAVLLRRAYAHEANPGILFNLARSLEGAGALSEAADAYEQYLEESDPDDRGAIEARILTLRDHARRLDAADRADEAERANRSEEGRETPAPAAERSEPEEPVEERRPSALPWIVAGTGVLAAGVGVYFGVRSSTLSDEAASEPQMQRAVEVHESAENAALLANIFLIGGGVLAAVGLTWGIVDATKSDGPSAQARIAPGGLVIDGTF